MLVLINLDSAVERRQAMARQLGDLGLAFERVGIDMRCMRPGDVDASVEQRFAGLRFDRKALSTAEIGCWLSHLTAWKCLLERPDAAACAVIEDDLRLMPHFAAAIDALARPSDFDLIYLGTSSRNVSQRRQTELAGFRVHAPVGVILNTWGYVITRGFAARFLAAGRRHIRHPIDHYLGGRGTRTRPRIGVLQPAAVREDPVLGAASQIGPYTRRIDRSPLVEKLRRRLMASSVSALYYALYRYL